METRRDARRDRREGIAGELGSWWAQRQEEWRTGERHLAYTLIACGAILLLGLIIVPLSIPDPLPKPEPAQLMGERYLRALPAKTADRPTLDEVMKTYGEDGGEACTAKLPDAYQQLLTKRPNGGMTFDKAKLARMRIVHRVYCPERTTEMSKYVRQRSAANARARQAALDAAAV